MAGADLSRGMAVPVSDAADIQGILRAGYGTLTEACFLLLRIADPGAARAWLAVAPVTTVGHLDRRIPTALQVALTAGGMRALGVAEPVVAGFSAEFVSGMAGEEGRSRRLGDVAANAPARWRWGGARVPDVLVMLYAERGLAAWRQQVATEQFRQGFEVIEELSTTDMGGKEPFGFADGISQPHLDWSGRRIPGSEADLEFGNLISPGEFLLGYRNEYGLYTDRPLLDPADAAARDLPAAQDDPNRRDLGRNGSYLVWRELHQDVRGFWRFVAGQADGSPPRLAEALVGRRMSGEPLIAPGARAIPGIGPDPVEIRRNQFTYEGDRNGLFCPLGAHVRRANPRTADMPGGRQSRLAQLIRMLGFGRPDLRDDLIAASRFHRILRRGREFGVPLSAEEALLPDAPDPRSGLHFICLNANISRQFEFIQNAWLMSAKFGGLSGESDPLIGNREPMPPSQPTDGFGLQQPNGPCRRIGGMPQFVTVAGGGYFFLPGLRALRYFATPRIG